MALPQHPAIDVQRVLVQWLGLSRLPLGVQVVRQVVVEIGRVGVVLSKHPSLYHTIYALENFFAPGPNVFHALDRS